MSSKNTASAPEPANPCPHGGGLEGLASILTGNPLERPLDRIYGPNEDSDWQVAFWDSLRPPAITTTQAPSSPWRNEDTSKPMDQEQPAKLDIDNNQPIELNENSQVIELDVPVVTISTDSLEPLWSQKFISCSSSPKYYESIPLYKAEGREDPEKDEGISEPSSPLASITSSPMVSGLSPTNIFMPSHHINASQDPQSAENFFPLMTDEFYDQCDVLQSVMDDSITNINFAPNILTPATITSGELQQQPIIGEGQGQATTATFITPIIKAEDSDLTILSPPSFTVPPSPSIKSELDDSDWEPDSQSSRSVRKRGRPAKPLGSRNITPRPPSNADSDSMTDDEVSAQKYRRMRDLNNEASRRCRELRKEKAGSMEKEVDILEVKNLQLKRIVAEMETEIKKLKKQVLEGVKNRPGRAAAVAPQEMIPAPQQFPEEDFLESLLRGASAESATTWPPRI